VGGLVLSQRVGGDGVGGEMCEKEVFMLRKYVSHVEYKLDIEPPAWDTVFGDGDGSDHDSGWDADRLLSGGGYDDDDDDDDDDDEGSVDNDDLEFW